MADLQPVLADLRAESDDLDALVSALSDDRWAIPTPAAGWTIAHQIAHLAWTDDAAVLAVTDPDEFAAEVQRLVPKFDTAVDEAAARGAKAEPEALRTRWRDGRAALAAALLAVPAGTKVGWFGPPMSATSMATARLMETWAHGQDVADALGIIRLPTPRLRHVAHIGVRSRDFAYVVRGRTPPPAPIRVALTAPDGTIWEWNGDDPVAQSVSGPALDFCLLVTQRRHRADLALVASGPDADQWLDIAQAFAGPPGAGRAAGQFSA